TSSPRSLRMLSTIVYSQAPSSGPCSVPSTLSGENLATAAAWLAAAAAESKRRWPRHAGHTGALSRMVALQCGQVRVAPASPGRGNAMSAQRALGLRGRRRRRRRRLGLVLPAEVGLA